MWVSGGQGVKPAITSPSGGQASPVRDVLSESLIDEMSASEVMPQMLRLLPAERLMSGKEDRNKK